MINLLNKTNDFIRIDKFVNKTYDFIRIINLFSKTYDLGKINLLLNKERCNSWKKSISAGLQ